MDTSSEGRESRRSLVRVAVTYAAALFLFVGGAGLIGWFMAVEKYPEAKDLFLTVLPVASAIVSYWFAGRSKQGADGSSGDTDQEGQQ